MIQSSKTRRLHPFSGFTGKGCFRLACLGNQKERYGSHRVREDLWGCKPECKQTKLRLEGESWEVRGRRVLVLWTGQRTRVGKRTHLERSGGPQRRWVKTSSPEPGRNPKSDWVALSSREGLTGGQLLDRPAEVLSRCLSCDWFIQTVLLCVIGSFCTSQAFAPAWKLPEGRKHKAQHTVGVQSDEQKKEWITRFKLHAWGFY